MLRRTKPCCSEITFSALSSSPRRSPGLCARGYDTVDNKRTSNSRNCLQLIGEGAVGLYGLSKKLLTACGHLAHQKKRKCVKLFLS
jgi:hypothetical protein